MPGSDGLTPNGAAEISHATNDPDDANDPVILPTSRPPWKADNDRIHSEDKPERFTEHLRKAYRVNQAGAWSEWSPNKPGELYLTSIGVTRKSGNFEFSLAPDFLGSEAFIERGRGDTRSSHDRGKILRQSSQSSLVVLILALDIRKRLMQRG